MIIKSVDYKIMNMVEDYEFEIDMNIDWPEDEDYDPVEDDITFFSTGNNFGWNTSYPNLSFQREDVQAEYEEFINNLNFIFEDDDIPLQKLAFLEEEESIIYEKEQIKITRI